MALVEVDDIELGTPQGGRVRAFAIDAPRIGGRDVYDIEVTGWVLGERQPVKEIEIHQSGVVVRRGQAGGVTRPLAAQRGISPPWLSPCRHFVLA